jgi:hypothetical protein
VITEKQLAERYTRLFAASLAETDDVGEAMAAADLALELSLEQPVKESDAYFAFDIFNRRAQGILNRALAAAKEISQTAKKALLAALNLANPGEMAQAVVRFIEKYRRQLTELLTVTQLASVLEGAREVASKVPRVPPAGLGGQLPSSIPPDAAQAILERISPLPTMEQWEEIYKLPADQQAFVVSNLRISGAMGPPPSFVPPRPPEGSPEEIQFPIIDEAVRDLSARNVVDKATYVELEYAARQKAFTVAAVDSQETLTKIRDALAENVREGADFETFKKRVLQDVSEGTFLSDLHFETVFRTNIQTAFSDGQMSVLNTPFVRSGFPYAAVHVIHDDRVREQHEEIEHIGIQSTNIFRVDDPVFQTFRGPWDYMCRCGWTPMTIKQAADAGIEEARAWMQTGVEPSPPAFVQMPSFQPRPEFRRSLAAQPIAVRLSMASIEWPVKKILEVPNVRQDDTFSCLAMCAMACAKYRGVGPDDKKEWIKNLGTNKKTSTDPVRIVQYLGELGLDVELRQYMTIDDLRKYISQDKPVICMVEEYSESEIKPDRDYGHGLVVIGVDLGRVFVQDPSADNVLEGEDSANVPGQNMVLEEEWMRRWRDRDYIQLGIVVGPKVRERLVTSKSDDGEFTIVHHDGYDEIVR